PGAHSHGYLMVARDGKPLSLSSLNEIFIELRLLDGLPDDLSPHILRYTWNDMFSELADRKIAEGKWTVDTEKLTRRYHQGWKLDSSMPFKYAQRHIQKEARKISLEMQRDYLGDGQIVDPAQVQKVIKEREAHEQGN